MRRNTKLLVAFTCVHAAVALGATVYSLAAGSAEFDNPDLPRMAGAWIADDMASLLTFPGRLLWTSRASRNLPNAVEWALFVANSAMWGAGAMALMNRLFERRQRPSGPFGAG